MLSEHEQKMLDDIERLWAVEAEEPFRVRTYVALQRTPDPPGLEDMPAVAAAGVWITIMLVLFGAALAGLAVASATALGWLLWRSWPQLARTGTAAASPMSGQVRNKGEVTRWSAETPPRRDLGGTPETD